MQICVVVEGHATKDVDYALRKRGRWAGRFVLRHDAKNPKVVSRKPAQIAQGGSGGFDFRYEAV